MINQAIKKYMRHLLIETCLQFNKKTRRQNKKVHKYIYGLRMDIMILSIYDMRSMITKIYPLIHNLFYSHSLKYQPVAHRLDEVITKSKYITPVQILFSSSTKKFSDIVEDAATFCSMPHYTRRWVNGLFTKPLNTMEDEVQTLYQNNLKKFQHTNIKNKFNYTRSPYGLLHNKYFNIWHPSMLILPDPSNNPIIWKEAKLMNIPTISLTSASSLLNANYSIFGNETSNAAVSFFCTLISWIVKKEKTMFNYRTEILSVFKLKEKTIKPFKPHTGWPADIKSSSFSQLLKYRTLKTAEIEKYRTGTKLLWRLYWAKYICGQNKTKLWRLRSLIDRRSKEFNYFYKYFRTLQNNIVNRIDKKIRYHIRKINVKNLKKMRTKWKKIVNTRQYVKNRHRGIYQRKKLIKWFAQLYFTLTLSKNSPIVTNNIKSSLIKNMQGMHNLVHMPVSANFIKKKLKAKRFLMVKDIAWSLAHTKHTKLISLYNKFVKYKFIYWGGRPFYSRKPIFWHARLKLKLAQYKRRDRRRVKRSFWRVFIRNLKKQFMRERILRRIRKKKRVLTNSLTIFPKYFSQKNRT